jgi:hypothetical protein
MDYPSARVMMWKDGRGMKMVREKRGRKMMIEYDYIHEEGMKNES